MVKQVKVAKIQPGEFELVLNSGEAEGVSNGQKFLVYRRDDEIFDPDTKESLGILEVVIGQGIVVQVQEKISVLRSIEKTKVPGRTIRHPTGTLSIISSLYGQKEEIIGPSVEDLPFDDPQVGDLCKRV